MLTKEILVQSRVIAKGKRIRDLAHLLQLYGGQSSKWVKRVAPYLKIMRNIMNTTDMSNMVLVALK